MSELKAVTTRINGVEKRVVDPDLEASILAYNVAAINAITGNLKTFEETVMDEWEKEDVQEWASIEAAIGVVVDAANKDPDVLKRLFEVLGREIEL